MATTNTTQSIITRGGFVPVLRNGNYAGQGYAGRLGAETLIEDPSINNGKPILASELTQTYRSAVLTAFYVKAESGTVAPRTSSTTFAGIQKTN